MILIFKIALRNLFRHKGKSIIIGSIIFFGSLIMTIGNGIISGMDKGLKQNIVDSFTGEVFIVSTNQKFNMVLFPPYGKDLEIISEYTNIRQILSNLNFIESFTPVARGNALVLNEKGDMAFTILLGVKFEEYYRMFKNIKILEGRFLTNNEKGILVSTLTRRIIYNNQNYWVIPSGFNLVESNIFDFVWSNINSVSDLELRSNIVFMGYGADGSGDVRVDVVGIIKYKNLNNLWQAFSIIDIESFRLCFNYMAVENINTNIKSEKIKLLQLDDQDSIDNLFNDETIVDLDSLKFNKNTTELIKRSKENNKKTFNNVDLDIGVYNMVLIKLKDNISIDKALKLINTELSNRKVDGRAITWKQAVGQLADIATIIRGALFGFVLFLFFVAAIVIMNTLSMAAIERTTEIGMMRAVGAQKSFIAKMFTMETGILSFCFGLSGIIIGAISVIVASSLQITTTNEYLQLLFGGEKFQPYLSFFDYLICIFQLFIVTLASIIYPIRVAIKITPLEAIARE